MEVTWILASFRQRATPHFLFLSHPLRCPSPPIEVIVCRLIFLRADNKNGPFLMQPQNTTALPASC